MRGISKDEYFTIIEESHAEYVGRIFGMDCNTKENRTERSALIDLIEPHVNGCETVLDIGVGFGVASLYLLKNGYMTKLIGLDNDRLVLETFEQNAERLDVKDKIKIVNWNMLYGVEEMTPSPDCILCMDILYGNPESAYGMNKYGRSPGLDNVVTLEALLDVLDGKIIIARYCKDTSGNCKTPDQMKNDLEYTGYRVTDFGSNICGEFAFDYAIAEHK